MALRTLVLALLAWPLGASWAAPGQATLTAAPTGAAGASPSAMLTPPSTGTPPTATPSLATPWRKPGAAPAQANPTAHSLGCLIEPDRVADVGAQVVGVVEGLSVERGDRVSAGQVLVRLGAGVERAAVDVANTRARVDAEVLAAQASLTLAEQKLARAQSLLAQKFVSPQAVEQANAELELARQRHLQTQGQVRIWGDERRMAEAQLALRTVRSPFAGVVVERFVNPGERVEDRPLLRVAVIDPLRVELMLPSHRWGSLRPGDRVTVHPELPNTGAVVATVRHIDNMLDAASNSFRVRLSLPNPDHRLPAGLRCKVDLPGSEQAAARPAAPPNGPAAQTLAPPLAQARAPAARSAP